MDRILKAKIIERFGSQFEFARAIGAHEAAISRIVRGHRKLSPEERLQWAKALDCDPENLLQK